MRKSSIVKPQLAVILSDEDGDKLSATAEGLKETFQTLSNGLASTINSWIISIILSIPNKQNQKVK